MLRQTLASIICVGALLFDLSLAQLAANPNCPNTLAIYNPNIRTQCNNATFFILPVPKDKVQSLVKPYSLIPPNTADKSLFPNGFPPNTHPVLLSSGYANDIRMIDLQIPALKQGNIYVPYVDRLKDGKTPFNYPVQNYIGGTKKFVEAYIPAVVGTAEGTNILPATITPLDNAYAPISSNPNEFSTEVKVNVVINDVSGPSVQPEAFDFDFISAKKPLYTEHTFHALVSQPIILNGLFSLLCQRNSYFFNQTFTQGVLRSGNVTIVPPLAGAGPKELAGVYATQGGYSASAINVGFNPEGCVAAAKNVDPVAVQ